MKWWLVFVAACALTIDTCSAETMATWQRVPFDDVGASTLVELYQPSGESAHAYFGYRCYSEEDKFGIDSVAYFVKLDNYDMACMKDPKANVTLTIDGKSYPFVFTCTSSGGSVYLEWGIGSRADLNNKYELDQAIDKSRSKEMLVTVTDTKHYVFRASLKKASIRNAVHSVCFKKR
jgi:hypothetical protein